MPYTDEPKGLAFINNLNITTFGPLVSQVCWLIGSVAFTVVACILMLRYDGPSLTAGTPTSHEAMRQLGLALAGYMLAAWTGKSVVGVVDAHSKRKAYVPLVEAEAKGKAEGEAITREHPAPVAATVKTKGEAETKVEAPPDDTRASTPTLPVPEPTEHEWAAGDEPKAGVL